MDSHGSGNDERAKSTSLASIIFSRALGPWKRTPKHDNISESDEVELGPISNPNPLAKSTKLRQLQSKADYHTWSAQVQATLEAKGLWYIVNRDDDEPFRSIKERFDNQTARKIILDHISDLKTSHLSHWRSAHEVWKRLRRVVFCCPTCLELKDIMYDVRLSFSELYESAEDGCESCRLLLDAMEGFAPGWSLGWTDPKFEAKGVNPASPMKETVPSKSISISKRTFLVRVVFEMEGVTRTVEFFPEPEIANCLLSNGPILHTSPHFYLSLASIWLKHCVESHPGCTIPDSTFVPNRLIDVGQEGTDPFLKDTNLESVHYAALSYCWGATQNTLTTTRENIADHRLRISFDSLPQTLKDAVTVCRHMGIRYLWIDALCIIQNDIGEQDWYTESGKMRHIYSNALVSIAADVSENCTYGFLGKQSGNPAWYSFTLPRRNNKVGNVLFWREATSYKHEDSSALTGSALSKRGWALQESILPNRILHFTSEEVVYECNMECQCECGDPDYYFVKLVSRGMTTKSHFQSDKILDFDDDIGDSNRFKHINTFLASRSPASVYWAWQTIIEYYTQRELTNHADKLSAMSGLAQVIVDSLGIKPGAYLAGLWQAQLLKDLLWHVRGPGEPRRYLEYHAPSWSWASILGGVKYFTEHYQFAFEPSVTVLEASCETSSLDPTGRVKSGHLLLRGQLTQVLLTVKRDYYTKYCGHNGAAGRAHQNQTVFVGALGMGLEVLLDESHEVGQWEHGFYCLEIGIYVDNRLGDGRAWWLVLKKKEDTPEEDFRTFERVGIGYTYMSSLNMTLFFNADDEIVKIV